MSQTPSAPFKPMWETQCHKQTYRLGMVNKPPIKMVIFGLVFFIGLPHDSYKTQLNIYSCGPKYQL